MKTMETYTVEAKPYRRKCYFGVIYGDYALQIIEYQS